MCGGCVIGCVAVQGLQTLVRVVGVTNFGTQAREVLQEESNVQPVVCAIVLTLC